MLVYLDTMVVQYTIDNYDFVFGRISGYSGECLVTEPKLRSELYALRDFMFMEQMGSLDYAFTPHLWDELNAGQVTEEQQKSYAILKRSWEESGWTDTFPLNEDEILRVEDSLKLLHLDAADRRHLVEAIVLKASWFLTNDERLLRRVKGQKLPLHVARPSECLSEIFVGLFLR